MAEYLINFVGNCCELFIIIFFLKDNYKLRVKKQFAIPLCGLFLMLQFVSNNLFLGESSLVIFVSITFVLLVSLIYEMKVLHRVLSIFFLFLIIGFSEIIVTTLLSVFNVDIKFIQNTPLVFAITTLAAKFLSYILVLFTKTKRFKIKDDSLKNNSLWAFLLPLASILIILLFLRCCYQINDNGFNIITLITSIVLIFANVAIFYIIDKQNDLLETKEKLFFTETHINSQIAHYEELYKHQTELKTFRHDIKNRLLALMGMLKESDIDKALHTMQSNLDMLDEMNKNIVNTGNPITDAILQAKLRDADNKGIKLRISVKLTEKIMIDELELGIVLGNALDNAIEAAARVREIPNKEIVFDMITTAERIVITIENPVDGNVNTNKLITSKRDKENHGYGVGSIKTISKKYDGIAEFNCSDGKFITNINIANIEPKR